MSRYMLSAALLALALALGSTEAAQLRMPHGRALQQTITGCDFTAADNAEAVLTDAWRNVNGYVLATTDGALACLNQIQIDYDFAYESVTNLAKIFNQSYVFVAIAANPTYNQPLSAIVYNYSVNVPGELQALADSLDPQSSVPLGDLQFAITDIFNRLYDAHVTFAGAGRSAIGTLFGNALRNATQLVPTSRGGDGRAYLVDTATSALLLQVSVAKASDGSYTVRGQFYTPARRIVYKTFATIDGDRPLDWFIALSNNPAISLPYKPAGSRVNQLLTSFESFRVNTLGNISNLPSAVVTFTDGTKGALAWGVTFSPVVTAARLATLQKQANTPGVPYMALLKAANTYLYGNATVVASEADPGSPAISSEPEAKESRRRLQAGATLPSSLEYITSDNGNVVGFYFFNRTTAVLKLTTFSFGLEVVQSFWPKFVAAAKQRGANELIIDLTGNGGGNVASGVSLALALNPNARYGDFGLRYDRIMGEDAVYAYANQLHSQTINATLQALAANATYLTARVNQIMANQTEFKRLTSQTRTIIQTLTVLFQSAQQDQLQVCRNFQTGNTVSCSQLWETIAPQVISFVSSIAGSKLTTKNFQTLIRGYFPALLDIFFPYTGAPGDDSSDPYAKPEIATRGGIPRFYTAKFDLLGLTPEVTVNDLLPDVRAGGQPPFKKILALSDGTCGSTCDTFSRTSYFYSKRHPSAPVFRYFTFGGTGKAEDAGATAFPGGNVNGNDLLSGAWAFYVIGSLTADWLDLPDLAARMDAWSELLPVFPAMLDNYTPTYTQSEVYQAGALGADSLPTEYLKIPSDYYAPVWYTNTAIPDPDMPTDLPALYATAHSVLTSMPGPKATQG